MTHHPRKRFGQHFLANTHILREIVCAIHPEKNDQMVEIGPGMGALTTQLLPHLNHLDAVELDHDLIAYLARRVDARQLTVHAADALNFSYAALSQHSHDLRVVGNLPYNISTPLLFKLFSEIHCIRDMHFMLQKEVVLRLTAEVGSADYGRLSVMSQFFCHNDYLFTVASDAFNPPPKVDSAMVRLTPKPQATLSHSQFETFSAVVTEAFNYRRKKLGNGLKRLISAEKLMTLDINPGLRAQEITVLEFIRISESISLE